MFIYDHHPKTGHLIEDLGGVFERLDGQESELGAVGAGLF